MNDPMIRQIALQLNVQLNKEPLLFFWYLSAWESNIKPVVQAFDQYLIEYKEVRLCTALTELATICVPRNIAPEYEKREKDGIIQTVGLFLEHYMTFHASTMNDIRSSIVEEGRDASMIPEMNVSLKDNVFPKFQQRALQMHQLLDRPFDFWEYMKCSSLFPAVLVQAFDIYAIPNKEHRFRLAVDALSGILGTDESVNKEFIRPFALFVKNYMVRRKRILAQIRSVLLLRYNYAADSVPQLLKLR
jgi:hypothetical protein